MTNINQLLPFYLINFKYQFFLFQCINDSSVTVEINDSIFMCCVDLFNETNNSLHVSYKNSSNRTKRDSNKETLISRVVDKLFRPFLAQFGYTVYISIVCLQGVDNTYYSALSALLAMRYLFPIDIGICSLTFQEKNTIFTDETSNNNGYLFMGGNSEKIVSLEFNCTPKPIEETNNLLVTAMEYCDQIHSILKNIKPQYQFNNIKNTKIKFQSLEHDYSSVGISNESIRRAVSSYITNHNISKPLRSITVKKCGNGVLFSRGLTTCYSSYKSFNDNDKKTEVNYGFYRFSTKSTQYPSKRRELGHSTLINNLINRVIHYCKFPVNVNCDTLSSDGSSSMASVCAASALLYTIGASPMVSGISVGLFKSSKKYKLKVDITAKEDMYSEMDCKIACTQNGIVGIYLDTKSFLPKHLLKKTLMLAYKTNNHILDIMTSNIEQTHSITPVKNIGSVVGPKGLVIKHINYVTNAQLEVLGHYVMYKLNMAHIIKKLLLTYDGKLKSGEKYLLLFKDEKPLLPYIKNIQCKNTPIKSIHNIIINQFNKDTITCKIID